jgi:ribonuclease HII
LTADLYQRERLLARELGGPVAGVDEVGRGPLAGPVVAAAVVLAPGEPIAGLADSKKLTAAARRRLFARIRREAVAIGVGWCSSGAVDRLTIGEATHHAMRRALGRLPVAPAHILVDGLPVPGLPVAHTAVVGGDAQCACVSAASIVAKVLRDRLMVRLGARYPQYGFERNKGYPTAEHREALAKSGPCRHHRRSYAPVRAVLEGASN